MITFRISTEVKDDRQVVLTLPPEVPTGKAELVVTVDSPPSDQAKRASAALLSAMEAEPRLSQEDVLELEKAIAQGKRPLSRVDPFSDEPRQAKAE